jgi:ABC-type Fe3+-hydroxamate transport system substrate-binding protein
MILNKTTELSNTPSRIISLVPSQTELLYHLGLSKQTIAITTFCVHPKKWHSNKTKVGGTKSLHIKKIIGLQPDLIIANKEENVKEQILELAAKTNVWVTDVNNLEDAYIMINDIGNLVGKAQKANELTQAIKHKFALLNNNNPAIDIAYLIWKKPYMTIGGDTFINDMLLKAGFNNIFSDSIRYPTITIEDLQKSAAKFIFLSSEPYPFKQKHVDELQEHLTDKTLILVDGEMFSWYGNRLLKATQYFKKLRINIEKMK